MEYGVKSVFRVYTDLYAIIFTEYDRVKRDKRTIR